MFTLLPHKCLTSGLVHFVRNTSHISSRAAAWSVSPRLAAATHTLFSLHRHLQSWPRQRRSGSSPSACTRLRWFEFPTPFHDETQCHFPSRCSCHGLAVLLHPEILPSYCKVHDRQAEYYLLVYLSSGCRNDHVNIPNIPYKIVAKFMYLVTNVTYQNDMHEDA